MECLTRIIPLAVAHNMKNIVILIIFLFGNTLFSQEILEHEKEINNKEDYNFNEVDFFVTKKNIKMGGTLITPKTDYSKIVIIAAGSGKDTRNSHYLLTESLLKNGIAVYRYDDRGVGKSEGKFKRNANHNIEDLYNAFKRIRKLDTLANKKIGILGHSMGAYAATINNYENELDIDFLVLLGSPIEWKGKWVKEHKSKETGKKISCEIIYKNINIPTLFIGGINDTTSSMPTASKLLSELANKNVEVKFLKDLDHYLRIGNDEWKQTKDYNGLYEIDENALELITNWIKYCGQQSIKIIGQ